jgi:hypothetical protein
VVFYEERQHLALLVSHRVSQSLHSGTRQRGEKVNILSATEAFSSFREAIKDYNA